MARKDIFKQLLNLAGLFKFPSAKDALRFYGSLVSGKNTTLPYFANNVPNANTGASALKDTDKNSIMKPIGKPVIGRMVFFNYDPKWKDKLPIYDIYPLVLPIEMYPDGFLGLNLHYLPPSGRAILLESLLTILNNEKFDKSTKMLVSYQLLKNNASRFPGYKQCIHRYLTTHIRSDIKEIQPTLWAYIVALPMQKFITKPGVRAPY